MFNRIIFPLKDEYGNIIAFSGRKIDKSDSAKYINYPDTVLFTKGDHLYNYSEAKNSIHLVLCAFCGTLPLKYLSKRSLYHHRFMV